MHDSGASRREIVNARLRNKIVGETNALVMPGLDPGIHPSTQ
jgi:hypothetical protein